MALAGGAYGTYDNFVLLCSLGIDASIRMAEDAVTKSHGTRGPGQEA
jgi:hypothetical protein